MNIWIILTVIFSAICVAFAIKGAIESHEGWIGNVAFLSIPIWLFSFMFIYSIHFQSGWKHQTAQKLLCLGIFITISLVMLLSNRMHGKIMQDKINKY